MTTGQTLSDTNWDYLLTLLPADWRELAMTTGAVRRLRGTDSVESLLRTLLLHVAHGCSLRTTSVVAKAAGWANMSDVALLKKLRACEGWLHKLCTGLLAQSGMSLPQTHRGLRMRLVDSTIIKEFGDTGSQWRVLYSLSVPGWHCDCFRLTPSKGAGNGESLKYFPVKTGDCLLADRGFSHLAGIESIHQRGGQVIVRLNDQVTPLEWEDGSPVDLGDWLGFLSQPGQVGGVNVWIPAAKGSNQRIPARLCAVRKSFEAAALAERKLKLKASRKQTDLRERTLENSAWIVVLTTVNQSVLNDAEVLEWYRVRWQIELAFKRLKSLGQFGHLPKRDPASSRAWVYGKLLVALLTEKMQRHAASFSPWGGRWQEQEAPSEPLA
jgi:Transposase DDE domain